MSAQKKSFRFFYLLGVFSFIVFIFAATLGLFELSYRFYRKNFADNFDQIDNPSHRAKAYVMYTAQPFHKDPNNARPSGEVNSLGYLGPLPDKVKLKNEYRIFVLGGSVVYNGSPPFTDDLEQRFHNEGLTNVKVFNFGIVSSVVRQELIRTLLEVSTYKPDLIISFTGFNDIYDTGWDPRINQPHRYILYQANSPFSYKSNGNSFFPFLALYSQFLRDLFPKPIFDALTKDLLPTDIPGRTALRPLIAQAFFQNLKMTDAVSKMVGANYAAYFQPTVYFKNSITEKEKGSIWPGFQERALTVRESILTEAKNQAHSHIDFTDLSDFYSNDPEQVFLDMVHFKNDMSKPYYQKLISFLYTDIKTRLLKKPQPKALLTDLIPENEFSDPYLKKPN